MLLLIHDAFDIVNIYVTLKVVVMVDRSKLVIDYEVSKNMRLRYSCHTLSVTHKVCLHIYKTKTIT